MQQPFEASSSDLLDDVDRYVDSVYESLESSFMVMPEGNSFVDYVQFQAAYECLKRHTHAFESFGSDQVWSSMEEDALCFVVLRSIAGLAPPELAYITSTDSDISVSQGAARQIDISARTRRDFVSRMSSSSASLTRSRLRAMVEIACSYIEAGSPTSSSGTVHRLDKMDTKSGLTSLRAAARLDVPYAAVLYERFLGRPFATHRDSVSGLVGNVMEDAVIARLDASAISYRQTRRAERIAGFDQAPDVIVPDEVAPRVVIEAKITNDDGTARDKFTCIIHLVELSRRRVGEGLPGFEVVACIDGRGFGIRREDMRRLILRTNGKVFTLRTLDKLVANTELKSFVSIMDDRDSRR